MATESKPISQKEYLKKYLSKGEKKRKKRPPKVSSSSVVKKSVIIDEDDELGLKNVSIEDDEFNFEFLGEDAPQVAGIIDERARDRSNPLFWKGIGAEPDSVGGQKERKSNGKSNLDDVPLQEDSDSDLDVQRKKSRKSPLLDKSHRRWKREDRSRRNESPKRNRRPRRDSSDVSPPRRSHDKRKSRKASDSDVSPPRRSKHNSHKNRPTSDSDVSPPRKSHATRKRHDQDSDFSPPRKISTKKKHSDSDASPPRKNHSKKSRKDSDSDISPPRKKVKDRKSRRDSSPAKKKRKNDSDSDVSPPRKTKKSGHDLSPSGQKQKRKNDSDISPPRKAKKSKSNGSDISPPRKLKRKKSVESDLSPPRKDKGKSKKSKKKKSPERKMEKTLDGKKAGLQQASSLKEELQAIKQKEDKMFKEMSGAMTGQGATTILRDRKTGRIRDLQKENEEKAEKARKEAERIEKYSRWGKGLAQVQETEQRIADTIKEMSKPLARYKDDEDLDKLLRERERDGDPMLEYIRKKQQEAIPADVSNKAQYKGAWMPNRFAVPPGHRWDGVDRSNGYEKKWIEASNIRRAGDEEAYKWSTEDM